MQSFFLKVKLKVKSFNTCVLRQQRSNIQHYDSPQKSTSRSSKPVQPFRFLKLPPEIRLMIYELVVGVDQRIQIDCALLAASSGSTMPGWNDCTCHDFSYREDIRRSTTIAYDLQTDKSQISTEMLTSSQPAVLNHVLIWTKATTLSKQDLRLLRTCRQIYDEACPVLYRSKTFVFLCLAAFAAYFGLSTPDQVHVPRSTEPHRLRTIQAMHKLEVHVPAVQDTFHDFLSASRLIRAGLGCLTSLADFELRLELQNTGFGRSALRIDDSMFSKPPSLRKLVISVWSSEFERMFAPPPQDDELEIANELLRRIMKQEGFSDAIEKFYR